jgi:hypothetical protein
MALEVKAGLFAHVHVPSHLAVDKCGGSRIQLHTNAAIYPRFLVWISSHRHSRYIFYALPGEPRHSPCICRYYSQRPPGTFLSPSDQNSLGAQIGQTNIEQSLPRVYRHLSIVL